MAELYPLIIDIYAHITPHRYIKALQDSDLDTPHVNRPALYNLEERFRIMDKYDGLVQVLTVGLPPVSRIGDKNRALDVARIANDEMAELVLKYPDRFVAGIAAVPMIDMDDALCEVDRAIKELKLKGVELPTPINDKPLDAAEFMPLYEKMQTYNLPIYIHPDRNADYTDYRTEDRSKYFIYTLWGWPYETTLAMTRLVCSGALEKYPDLKVITHHCGAMVPYFKDRIINFYDLFQMRAGLDLPLRKAPIEYFKKFYLDTALYGNPSALMCAYEFCGADQMVFGADMPLGDSQMGYRNYRQTLNAIDEMPISEPEKKKILQDNARQLLRLPV
jgi:predicted TIM-barrel fold metal-dependent hydrolase